MISNLLTSRTGSFIWAVLVGQAFEVLLPPEIWVPVVILTALVRLSVAGGLLVGTTLPPEIILIVTGCVIALGILAALWPYLMAQAYLAELSDLDEQEINEALGPPLDAPWYADGNVEESLDLDTTPLTGKGDNAPADDSQSATGRTGSTRRAP